MNYSQIMSPVPLCLEKWGEGRGHDPQAPMGACVRALELDLLELEAKYWYNT